MPIILNSGTNPEAAKYNSASLDTVYHRFSGGSYTKVWEKASHPVLDDSIITLVHGDFKIWLRNLTYDLTRGQVYYGNTLYNQHEYHGDCTVEIPFDVAKGSYLGVTNLGQTFNLFRASLSLSEWSGLPSGCMVYSFYLPSGRTIGLGCYQLTVVNGQGVIGDRVKTYGFGVYSDKFLLTAEYASLSVNDTCDGTYAVYNDLIEGWVYQGNTPRVIVLEPAS